jgi:hypothetical protein
LTLLDHRARCGGDVHLSVCTAKENSIMVFDFLDQIVTGHGFEMVAAIIGSLLWVLAYVLMIRKGYQDKTYGLPLLAIMLNFSWEFIYVVVYPPDDRTVLWLRIAWLVFDVCNVWLLVRYGKAMQSVPEIRQHFYSVLVWTFALCYVGHLAMHYKFVDHPATDSAYSINFIMSVLFVFMYFNRRDLRGLSYGAAWAKMLGTGIMSLAGFIGFLREGSPDYFLEYLFVCVFLFDVLYIYFLHKAARHPAPIVVEPFRTLG